jgi:hypothetical protein
MARSKEGAIHPEAEEVTWAVEDLVAVGRATARAAR